METADILRLNLLDNAYDYLNSAIEYVVKAKKSDSQKSWKFAVINIAQCIELLLKERLRREHEILLYGDLDRYKPITRHTKTVSWSVLLERIKFVLGEEFAKLDAGRLNLAQNLRNQMVHYDVELKFPEVYHQFANLLNFVVEFHETYLKNFVKGDLHEKVDSELWREEENLYRAFYEHIVYYNGIFMSKDLKEEIQEEQNAQILIIDGTQYPRVRYGSIEEYDIEDRKYANEPCHDCSVIRGQIHLLGCDVECCPKCKGQLISCGCSYTFPPES